MTLPESCELSTNFLKYLKCTSLKRRENFSLRHLPVQDSEGALQGSEENEEGKDLREEDFETS